MLEEIITQITPIIQNFGPWGVFFVTAIEEIVVPIPSSFSLLAAGFFLIPEDISFWRALLGAVATVGVPGALGFAFGSTFIYAAAYLGGEPFIRKYGKWAKVSWEDIEKLEKRFMGTKADEWVLVGLRALPVVPSGLVSVACGVLKYPFRNFLVVSFFGSLLRTAALALLGWSLGAAFTIYADQFSEMARWALWSLGAAAAVGGAAWWWRRRGKKRGKRGGKSE